MHKVLDGAARTEETDVDGMVGWETANNNIYLILFLDIEGSANVTLRGLSLIHI